jgi:hypothetical protein
MLVSLSNFQECQPNARAFIADAIARAHLNLFSKSISSNLFFAFSRKIANKRISALAIKAGSKAMAQNERRIRRKVHSTFNPNGSK